MAWLCSPGNDDRYAAVEGSQPASTTGRVRRAWRRRPSATLGVLEGVQKLSWWGRAQGGDGDAAVAVLARVLAEDSTKLFAVP